jgi:hypothetical protein
MQLLARNDPEEFRRRLVDTKEKSDKTNGQEIKRINKYVNNLEDKNRFASAWGYVKQEVKD